MAWSLKKIVGLVIIPLMVASTVFTSLGSIHTSTIEPKGEDAKTAINDFGRHIVLGKDSNGEVAAEQLKDATMINQLSAFNCAFMASVMGGNYMPDSSVNTALNNGEVDYTIYNRPDSNMKLGQYLFQTGTFPSCAGAQTMKLPGVDSELPSVTGVIADSSRIGQFFQSIDDVMGVLSCNKLTAMQKQVGNDMEGVYGKITFESRKTFALGTGPHDALWAMNMKAESEAAGCPLHNTPGREVQGLWKGKDASEFMPYPVTGVSSDNIDQRMRQGIKKIKDFYGDSNYISDDDIPRVEEEEGKSLWSSFYSAIGDPDSDAQYAGEVFVDAPLVVENKDAWNNCDTKGFPECIADKSHYVICENAEGFIQTNTITPGHEQESTNNPAELLGAEYDQNTGESSVTYTYIHVTKNNDSCMSGTPKTAEVSGTEFKYYTDSPLSTSEMNLPTGSSSSSSSSSGSSGSTSTVSGNLINSVTYEYTGGSPNAIEKSGSKIKLRPEEPDSKAHLVWEPLPSGDKTVKITLEFSEKGPVYISLQETATGSATTAADLISEISTSPEGTHDVWLEDPSGSYYEIGFDYSTGVEYTITAEKNGNNLKWTVKEGNTVQWSQTYNINNDFKRIKIKSFTPPEWFGEPDNPKVTIKEVEVTQSEN
ncbi:MAG: hypothetical protein ABEJ93_01735 [Candidatus Nanohalobium sp.]